MWKLVNGSNSQVSAAKKGVGKVSDLRKRWDELLQKLPAVVSIYPDEVAFAIEDGLGPAEWYNGLDITHPPFQAGDKVMLLMKQVRIEDLNLLGSTLTIKQLHPTPLDGKIVWDIEFDPHLPYLVTAEDVRKL
jgi:hypothetical protein